MANEQTIEIGQKVRVIVEVWTEFENPTTRNFYSGRVQEIIKRSAHSFYLRVSGLDKLIPIDRARAIA